MAVSSLKYPKTPYHARSISLPSRSNPLTLPVEEQLYRLRTSSSDEVISSSSAPLTSLSSLFDNLSGLNVLYDCVDDLFQSPITHRALAQEKCDKCVNDVLDGSLALLDTCSTTRDVLLQMKECIQDLQSSLRRKSRRRDGEFGLLENEVENYMNSRRKVTKAIQKCLRDLKRMENRRAFPTLFEKDQNLVAIISVLREVEWITLSTFEALFSTLLSGSKAQSSSKPAIKGWSLVSKLMHIRCGETNNKGEEAADMCEIEEVDIALNTLIISCKYNSIEVIVHNVQNVQKGLEALELSIHRLEDELELVFKSLIKARVSLLNILSN
ncbi:Protein of unknown function DUF241 [Macleaya cordata]|uniref:DUF241 domain-containing protein n=1 Tax=Macleaya cordata TaxID=56857 RepID=A0A200QYU5_MACCD|nr:Protein of unknown function DUF241 [Macleaya cordata]